MYLNIVDYLQHNSASLPEKTVVSHNNQEYTYSELWRNVNRISHYLMANGVLKADRVALLLENSFEYISVYYAVLMAGAVVVPLNTAAKANDISNWVKHSDAEWLFVEQANKELPELFKRLEHSVNYILVGKDPAEADKFTGVTVCYLSSIAEADYSNRPLNIYQDDLASIIYTSGTTGQPKGVTLSHGNLLCNMKSILEYLPVSKMDRCLNVLPFYYSYGNSVLHTHLMAGATLILENSFLFPHVILKKIQDEKVTSFSGVPSTFALLINRTKLENFDLSSIRYMTQAGGAMLPAHLEKIRSFLPAIDFFVMYGQTEATARLSYLPSDKLAEKISSIGIAIPGVTLKICDTQGKQVAQGEIGEIYASGPNIMQGYWNDREMTDKVIHNSWLKTGDLAKQDEEGYFYIIGRKTEMIKSGAHRISPLDIEEVILRCEGVDEVAVVGKKDELLGQVIKAFIVLQPGIELSKRDMLSHCKKYLASYKIPKYLEFLEELPKTASGKLKRFELQEN